MTSRFSISQSFRTRSFVLIIAFIALACDPTPAEPRLQIVGWGQNNILSKWIEAQPPQSFLVVKVRLPLELVGTEQPDGSVHCHVSSRDFTLVRTKSALGVRDFQPAGAKFDSQGFLEGHVEQTLNFPKEKKPIAVEWIVFFPLSTVDASLPSYALRFRDQSLAHLPPSKLESVESLTDPKAVWPEP